MRISARRDIETFAIRDSAVVIIRQVDLSAIRTRVIETTMAMGYRQAAPSIHTSQPGSWNLTSSTTAKRVDQTIPSSSQKGQALGVSNQTYDQADAPEERGIHRNQSSHALNMPFRSSSSTAFNRAEPVCLPKMVRSIDVRSQVSARFSTQSVQGFQSRCL